MALSSGASLMRRVYGQPDTSFHIPKYIRYSFSFFLCSIFQLSPVPHLFPTYPHFDSTVPHLYRLFSFHIRSLYLFFSRHSLPSDPQSCVLNTSVLTAL